MSGPLLKPHCPTCGSSYAWPRAMTITRPGAVEHHFTCALCRTEYTAIATLVQDVHRRQP